MKLHRFIRSTYEDFWGQIIPVLQWVEAVEVEICDTRPYNNGYEVVDIQVAKSKDEIFFPRIFDRPIEVDYFGGSDWYERDTDWNFVSGPWRALPRKSERYVDGFGNPITWESIR